MCWIRQSSDFVLGFREETDARNCLGALKDRFTKFGLELHPEKTRLIEFGRHAAARRSQRGDDPPETFDFLGFTHISGKNRNGMFIIRRISALKKLKAKLKELKDKLKRMVHWDLAEVGSWLSSVYKGWCNYHAVPLNSTAKQRGQVLFSRAITRTPLVNNGPVPFLFPCPQNFGSKSWISHGDTEARRPRWERQFRRPTKRDHDPHSASTGIRNGPDKRQSRVSQGITSV